MVKEGDPSQLRGALAQTFTDSHIQIWTQDVSITVFGPDAESMRALVQALRPLNALASVGPGGEFQPPEPLESLNCPPLSPGDIIIESGGRTP